MSYLFVVLIADGKDLTVLNHTISRYRFVTRFTTVVTEENSKRDRGKKIRKQFVCMHQPKNKITYSKVHDSFKLNQSYEKKEVSRRKRRPQ